MQQRRKSVSRFDRLLRLYRRSASMSSQKKKKKDKAIIIGSSEIWKIRKTGVTGVTSARRFRIWHEDESKFEMASCHAISGAWAISPGPASQFTYMGLKLRSQVEYRTQRRITPKKGKGVGSEKINWCARTND